MSDYSSHYVLSSLGTTNIIVPVTGPLNLNGKLTLPNKSQGDSADSQVVVSITQNGTARLATNPGAEGFQLGLICAPGDVLAVTLSSAAAIDALTTTSIKCTLSIG